MRTRIHHLLEERAGTHPDSPALTSGADTVSYAEAWDAVGRLASGFEGLGLVRDDRVAVFLDKKIETVTSLLASSLAGGVFVPVNPVFKPRQVGHVVRDSGSRILVTTARRWATLATALADTDLRDVVLVDGPVAGTGSEPPDVSVHELGRLLAAPSREAVSPRPPDSDMAAILYTSGSTGSPKGVVLSHRNMLIGAESVSSYLGNDADDVILAALPLSFDAGLSQVTTGLAVGAHVVLANYLVARDLVELCARHGVTGLTCVPPLWVQLVEQQWPAEARSSMRYFANTGGRMPAATLKRLRDLFPSARPYLMYGLTEAFRSTYLDPDEVDRHGDSIGKAIPDAEILVLRPDGSACEPGEEGELVHRGPLVALGYWNDPERTAQRFRPLPGRAAWQAEERAVWSGDTVVADELGFLSFVGRADEMIKTSGYRVSPTEVEEAAYETGLVRDAVALGVPDEKLGQRIVLVVASTPGGTVDGTGLSRLLRRELPLYMVPSEVLVREELPRSPNGKFDRVALAPEVAREIAARTRGAGS
ncbi:acyl-CoA ligase (AMP-forming), exosortase A-associated [Nocardioides alpinus]|uniref:Acyl-CoA ligase (AMP-forming), exosortase A system-associated n=1 Tax=Nocardioides alpinus TaxID=748909 RepID=A0A1I0VRR4_9ACTN|nr:acyl-CoA ligase (AMP-forming), exosortase A system-associated [Nocardioides alpinus]PKH37436.1 acyl-CoA ligase (AMP-forming), exosortase A system-associated [Nocardioides alpinus]SFA79044.1 acyl-CoA ligase (AMP-forming), exosortase A-associated [Nocardioides alpinus]